MTEIHIENINAAYGKKDVLFDINLDIEKGSIFGMIGPSGCGKTTLVKIIMGLLRQKSGTVTVAGELMPSVEAINKMGYMAQAAALYTLLNGRENLEFFGKLYGLKGDNLRERVKYVADLVNLTAELNKPVGDYSLGMQQRLSLVTALIHEPSILVLDEPTVGIDPVLRIEIWNELRNLADKGTTIIITTHVMDEAERCDKLAIIRDGILLATGTATAIEQANDCNNIEEVFLKLAGKEADNEN